MRCPDLFQDETRQVHEDRNNAGDVGYTGDGGLESKKEEEKKKQQQNSLTEGERSRHVVEKETQYQTPGMQTGWRCWTRQNTLKRKFNRERKTRNRLTVTTRRNKSGGAA